MPSLSPLVPFFPTNKRRGAKYAGRHRRDRRSATLITRAGDAGIRDRLGSEWYDFFIYGTAAALVFNEMFFPKLDPRIGTLAAFATFGVGFFARPFGGLVFGHFGDRIGRKPMLVVTLLLGRRCHFSDPASIPSYASSGIGILAPILLVVLRLLQGFGAGAEYGGAVIFAVEYAPEGRRGLFGSWAPIGVTVGNLLAAAVFAIVTLISNEDLLSWGWRHPRSCSSAILVALGLYIRVSVAETPVFTEVTQQRKPLKAPVLDAIRRHPRSFLVVIGSRMAENGLGYLFPVFGLKTTWCSSCTCRKASPCSG